MNFKKQLDLFDQGINVISFCDGKSCGQQALKELEIKVNNYFAFEIDPHAIKIAKKNFPGTIHMGDMNKCDPYKFENIDMVLSGTPCQSLSTLGKGEGFDGKSGLFIKYIELLNHIKIKNPEVEILAENVVPKKNQWKSLMDNLMGLHGEKINTKVFLPQSRTRIYWSNIQYEKPEFESILKLENILQYDTQEKYIMSAAWNKWWNENKEFQQSKKYSQVDGEISICLTARMYASWNGQFITHESGLRKLTPIECERLQGLPDNYTYGVPDTERYKMIGNGWSLPPVKHILKHSRYYGQV